MNIGIFTYDFYPIKGGQGTHVYGIYNELLERGFDNFYIFSPCNNNLKRHIQIFKYLKYLPGKHILLSIYLHFRYNYLIKKYNLGLLHIHGGPGGLFFLKNIGNVKVIYTCHHTYWQQYNYILRQGWKKVFFLFEKKSYKKADNVICVSKDTKMVLFNKYGIAEDKLSYIPNRIDLNIFSYDNSIRKEDKSLMFAGRLEERKGIDFLLKDIIPLLKKDKMIKLYISGCGRLQNKLLRMIKNNNLMSQIVFIGWLPRQELIIRMQKSEILIIPSIFEGFGIVALEAMALKTSVIACDVDGLKGIIEDGKNGLLVPYGDGERMRKVIEELLLDDRLREKLVEYAYTSVKKLYNKDVIINNWIDVYKLN